MKLYEVSNFVRKVINIIIGVVLLISLYLYLQPAAIRLFEQVKPEPEEVIPYKFSKINFTLDSNMSYNLSQAKINYLGNPDNQWQNEIKKKLKVYKYNFSSIEDIDYTPRAKQIALSLGYDDLNQTDNAELSNKYRWLKNGLIFEIDKVTKRMVQLPTQPNFASFKQYLSAGNFITPASPKPFVSNFLATTGRFSENELKNIEMESQFLRFESNNLVESNNIAAELSYVKVFRKVSDLKVVSKRYEFPQIYFYVSSLRPEIENSFKNYRFMHFKINKLDYTEGFTGYEFDLTPLPVVVNEIKQGKFIVSDIKFSGESFGATPNPENVNIQNITFDSYEIGYYDNYEDTLTNEFVQPVYVFKGTVELSSGARGRIVGYAPAIDQKYILN